MSHDNTFTATRNACKLCAPLGASMVFKGIKGAIPLLHGSQGCATYIRRYMISHFKEPVDIASSNFSEETAIFGGSSNLLEAIENVTKQYHPSVIGVATTCLSETIGDDVKGMIREYENTHDTTIGPVIIHVATPSFKGTHMMGFDNSVYALVKKFACNGIAKKNIAVFPGFLSPADYRHIKEIIRDYKYKCTLVPDYSETLDGALWQTYQRIPGGGTTVKELTALGSAYVAIQFGHSIGDTDSVTGLLKRCFFMPSFIMGFPIGVEATDALMKLLGEITERKMPVKYAEERGRLLDAYADAHKYIFGKKAVVFGEEDLVISMASFLFEIGMMPVICASGAKTGIMRTEIAKLEKHYGKEIDVYEDVDFADILDAAKHVMPDILIGNSKGYLLARELDIPLVRIGFPIHDRIGGARILHIGYRGTHMLFDRIVNVLIEHKQAHSPIGYTYL